MSTTTNNVNVQLMYEDSTTRTYTFTDVDEGALDYVATKVKAINDNNNQQYDAFYNTFVSKSGAKVMRIASAKGITIEEEVIYSAD